MDVINNITTLSDCIKAYTRYNNVRHDQDAPTYQLKKTHDTVKKTYNRFLYDNPEIRFFLASLSRQPYIINDLIPFAVMIEKKKQQITKKLRTFYAPSKLSKKATTNSSQGNTKNNSNKTL